MGRLQEASSRLHAAIGREQGGQGRNFVCSPLSALIVFLIAMKGAKGPTYNEMQSFLGITQMSALPPPGRPRSDVGSPDHPSSEEGDTTGDSPAGSSPAAGRARKERTGAPREGFGMGKSRPRGPTSGDSSPERRRPDPGDFQYTVFRLAARLYVNETMKSTEVFHRYKESVREAVSGRADVYALDFSDGPQAEQAVNAFVAKATESHIPRIISPGLITPRTRLLAVSAAFFGSRWKTPFDEYRTSKASFYAIKKVTAENLTSLEQRRREDKQTDAKHPASADPQKVDEREEGSALRPQSSSEDVRVVEQTVWTMYVKIEKPPFYVQETTDYLAVGLPYADEHYVMFIIMPHDPKNLSLVTRRAKGTHFPHAEQVIEDMKLKALTLRNVHLIVHLPKFALKVDENYIDLKTVFAQRLGVPTPFDPNEADFQGIDGGKEQLYVSDFVHAAEIEVNEKGTRAAGATALSIAARCMPPPPDAILQVHISGPFYFQVRYLGQKLEGNDDEDAWEERPARKPIGAAASFDEEVAGGQDIVLFSGEVYDAAAAQT